MNYAVARRHMVDNQIRTNHVFDERVIAAMAAVPRERFVPDALQPVAYVDGDVEVGPGRRLMEPSTFARLVQAAAIGANEVVLDVGCASGYSAAVLGRLASTVVALETDAALGALAAQRLAELGADNVALISAPLGDGDAAHGPYDVIVVEGAVDHIPAALREQLGEGGRLVAVVVDARGVGRATLFQRVRGAVSSRTLFDAQVGALPEFANKPCFVF